MLEEVRDEALKLHSAPSGDFSMDTWNYFERGVGHFWGLHEPRDYMRSRYRLLDKLLAVGWDHDQKVARAMAIEHCADLLRLNRGDAYALPRLPSLLVEAGRVQESYDLLKFFAVTNSGDYSEDASTPYACFHGEDVAEGIHIWDLDGGDKPREWVFDLAFIKLTALRCLRRVNVTRAVLRGLEGVADVALDRILDFLGGYHPAAARLDDDDADASLVREIAALLTYVHEKMPEFIPCFTADRPPINEKITEFAFGSRKEVVYRFQPRYHPWRATNSIGVLRAFLAFGPRIPLPRNSLADDRRAAAEAAKDAKSRLQTFMTNSAIGYLCAHYRDPAVRQLADDVFMLDSVVDALVHPPDHVASMPELLIFHNRNLLGRLFSNIIASERNTPDNRALLFGDVARSSDFIDILDLTSSTHQSSFFF